MLGQNYLKICFFTFRISVKNFTKYPFRILPGILSICLINNLLFLFYFFNILLYSGTQVHNGPEAVCPCLKRRNIRVGPKRQCPTEWHDVAPFGHCHSFWAFSPLLLAQVLWRRRTCEFFFKANQKIDGMLKILIHKALNLILVYFGI